MALIGGNGLGGSILTRALHVPAIVSRDVMGLEERAWLFTLLGAHMTLDV